MKNLILIVCAMCALSIGVDAGYSVRTETFAYQYTTDGSLQQVAIYSDGAVGTNLEGPRKGAQMVVSNNGAILDICNTYMDLQDHWTHKYVWGEINSYGSYQTITYN